MRATRISVLCVAPFNNPHIVPTYDALAEHAELNVTRVCLQPLPSSRIQMGWPEMAAGASYLQPWRRVSDRFEYWRALHKCDAVVFPGFHHFRTLPLHHWWRRLSGKTTLMWSEPFLGHHRRPIWYYKALAFLKFPVNSSKVHVLAMGGEDAAEDNLAVGGSSHWRNWRFGFAVEPVLTLDKDFRALLDRPIRIVYSGSLIERKRVDLLVRALGTAAISNMNWRLDIVGDGPSKSELQALAVSLGVQDRITFHGFLPIDQSHRILCAGDILVLPSRFDGWGAIVNEAMEYGLAIVCSDSVGAKMMVAPGINGYIFANGDQRQLADYLEQMIGQPERLVEMCRASRQRIEQFRPAAAATRLAALLLGLTGQAPLPTYGDGLCSKIVPRRYALRELAQSRLGAQG